MLVLLCLASMVAAKDYFMCDDNKHACVVGTTCCPEGNGFGCCPMTVGICCNDDGGHCCPQGYPICDNNHHICKDHSTGSVPKQSKVEARRLSLNPKQYTEFLTGFVAGAKAELSPVDLRTCVSETYFATESLIQLTRYLTETHYS